jgi:hypothetical protein
MEVILKRPDYGNIGKNIKLKTNYFEIKLENINVFIYRIIFPEPYKKDKKTLLINNIMEKYDVYFWFDGFDIIISKKNINFKEFIINNINIKIKYIEINKNEDNSLIINSIIRSFLLKIYYNKGNKFFNNEIVNIDNSLLELRNGIFTSIFFSPSKYFININNIFGIFYKPTELLHIFLNSKINKNIIENEILNLNIKTTHCKSNYKKYNIKGLTKLPANKLSFEMKPVVGFGPTYSITISEYFKKKYKELKYPHLPCVIVNKERNILFPVEICRILDNQKRYEKIDNKELSHIIKITKTNPDKYINNIYNNIEKINKYIDADINMVIDPKMTEINARILPDPSFTYDNDLNTNIKILWSIFIFSDKKEKIIIVNFIKELILEAKKINMNLDNNPNVIYTSLKDNFYDKFKLEKQNSKHFILCLNEDEFIYNKIKTISDIYIGIITQCALINKALKTNNKPYYKNIIFKIKSKLGYKGPDITIPLIKNNKTIIFGADVTHYTHANNIPSIASLVSTTNDNFFNHAGIFQYQKPRQEIIEKIDEMVYKLICNYKNINKYYPENMIFYRDGVSKNRFNHVLDEEINKIKKKLKQLNIDIKITFIIVQKRHNTKFFPINKIMSDKNGNCFPGTIVDTDICNENSYDFYLQSHRTFIGTAKPIHYTIIKNEMNIKPNDIQQITYYLCYLYGRTNNSVSLVPAVYYAHILCSRARIYKEHLTINKRIENTMFFI